MCFQFSVFIVGYLHALLWRESFTPKTWKYKWELFPLLPEGAGASLCNEAGRLAPQQRQIRVLRRRNKRTNVVIKRTAVISFEKVLSYLGFRTTERIERC